jgi:hypothetical protein
MYNVALPVGLQVVHVVRSTANVALEYGSIDTSRESGTGRRVTVTVYMGRPGSVYHRTGTRTVPVLSDKGRYCT